VAKAWITLDRIDSDAGPIELRRRDADDFLITIGGRVLMNSRLHRSEVALAELACRHLAGLRRPVVLIGGLGMGYTLRAALDQLPADARVVVAEINPVVVDWCRSHLAELTDNAVGDRRVGVKIENVTATIARAARGENAAKLDAILLDLYEGPGPSTSPRDDPLYGEHALRQIRTALRPGGVLAVWSEEPSAGYERRLRAAGYRVERSRPGRGGLRHAVYVATRTD
jgi:spermidine synthase